MRHLNLIFQGGGVKGIAYAGALQSLPDEIVVHGVGGTSAGAIVAGLVAQGKRRKELKGVLEDPKLFRLLKSEDAVRYARFTAAWQKKGKWEAALADAKPMLTGLKGAGLKEAYGIKRQWDEFQRKHAEVLADLEALVADVAASFNGKGIHSTGPLRSWLDGIFQSITFKELHDGGIDLRIVAADVAKRDYVIFNWEDYGAMRIARAIHASISVPLFFQPVISADDCFVDGGILSNFPSFLFDQSPYPTVGLRLVQEDVVLPSYQTGLGFLWAMVETMTSAHDKHRQRLQTFQSYEILTPASIPFDKFDLTPDDVKTLYERGVRVNQGKGIPWRDDTHSSEEERVRYFDPMPHIVLGEALEQAERLFEEHTAAEYWVDEIEQETLLRLIISEDWSTCYRREDTIKVTGSKSLFIHRVKLKFQAEKRLRSLSELKPEVVQVMEDGDTNPLIYLPAYNTREEKGFLIFFLPPISGDGPPFKLRTTMTMDKEFENTLVRLGHEDLSLKILRRADKHAVRARFEILTVQESDHYKFTPTIGAKKQTRIKPNQLTKETIGSTEYHRVGWEFPQWHAEKDDKVRRIEIHLAGIKGKGAPGDAIL